MKKIWIALAPILAAAALVGATLAHAQGATPPQTNYIGAQACAGCHPAEYRAWAASPHARMIQDPKATTATIILADFDRFTEVITNPRLKYDVKDVVFTLGWRYSQRYILRNKAGRLVMGAGQWNIAGQWQPAPAGEDWLNECAGCHTTGLDLAAVGKFKSGSALPFAEPGISCEACHGPGSAHVAKPSSSTIPVNRIQAQNAAICGQCHTRGSSPEVNGVKYAYPVSYTYGSELTAMNYVPVKPTGLVTDTNWWSDGHAKQYRQQYLEWGMSRHAKSLETLQKSSSATPACLGCHSADYIAATSGVKSGQAGTGVVTPTVKTAQFGITCQVCHAPHKTSPPSSDPLLRDESYKVCVACHNATGGGQRPLTPGAQASYSTQEMFEGKGALDVDSNPSSHLTNKAGPVCASCHMPGTATSANTGPVATHNWKIVMPGKAQAQESDACSACHSPESKIRPLNTAALQGIIASQQTEIKGALKTLTKQLKDVKSVHPEWDPKAERKTEQQVAYEKALTNISFAESEGSLGIHNYEYARAILDKAAEQLAFAAIPPTPTPTPEPTATPVPTPTPVRLPPTPTPVPPPSGGTSWPVWFGVVGVIAVAIIVLIGRIPKPG